MDVNHVRLELRRNLEHSAVDGQGRHISAHLHDSPPRVVRIFETQGMDLMPRPSKHVLLEVRNDILASTFPVAGVDLQDPGQSRRLSAGLDEAAAIRQ